MQRCLAGWLIVLAVCAMEGGRAAPAYAQGAFPRVYGPTGRPYGPTQAHYQYERQYGRPWHGGPAPYHPNGGLEINIGVPGVGFGYGIYPGYYPPVPGYYGAGYPYVGGNVPYGMVGYGAGYSYNGFPGVIGIGGTWGYGYSAGYSGVGYPGGAAGLSPSPVVPFNGSQPFLGAAPNAPALRPLADFNAAQAGQADIARRRLEDEARFAPQVPQQQVDRIDPIRTRPPQHIPAAPSTPEQQQKSLHAIGQGDEWFRQQNYLQAYSRYKQAANSAPDQSLPRYRMAWALIALNRFDLAVVELQRAVRVDPSSPASAQGFSEVIGEKNALAAMTIRERTVEWVRNDPRSPERLFLLGALLMLDGDHERAAPLLSAAAQFGSSPGWVRSFQVALGAPTAKNIPASTGPAPAPEQPTVPPAGKQVEQILQDGVKFLPPKTGTDTAQRIPQATDLPDPQPIPKKGSTPIVPAGGASEADSEAAGVTPIPTTNEQKTAAPKSKPAENGPTLGDPAGGDSSGTP